LGKYCIVMFLVLSSCATARIEKIIDDNGTQTCTAKFTSVFRNYEGVSMSACGGEGGASGAAADTALSEALIGVLAKGLTK